MVSCRGGGRAVSCLIARMPREGCGRGTRDCAHLLRDDGTAQAVQVLRLSSRGSVHVLSPIKGNLCVLVSGQWHDAPRANKYPWIGCVTCIAL
jgi:hypothetical protein